MTDSSTPGIIQPIPPPGQPAPLGQYALAFQFFQPWLVSLTGLPGPMVRPSFQAEPLDLPDAGECWMAFRYSTRPADEFPFIGHSGAGNGFDQLQRHEMISLQCSVYDLGITGIADDTATLLRDNISIPQNVEILSLNSMGIASLGDILPVPVIVKNRWQYRVDFPFVVRRQVIRNYPVLSVDAVNGILYTDTGVTATFTTS